MLRLRGAGKSTLGQALAKELRRPFIELDGEIEREAGMNLSEVFHLYGQAGYRKFERRCLERIINRQEDIVRVAEAVDCSVMTDGDRFLEVPGGTVFTRRWGSPSSDLAPIILMHDSLGCVELWRDFPAELARAARRSVIAYDRLGFGQSTLRTTRASVNFVREEAENVLPVLLSQLALDRCVLLGHSVGGSMALASAALHERKCEAVITEAAQTFVEPLTLEGIRAAKRQFSDPAELKRLARWHGPRAPWVLDAWTEVWLSPCCPASHARRKSGSADRSG